MWLETLKVFEMSRGSAFRPGWACTWTYFSASLTLGQVRLMLWPKVRLVGKKAQVLAHSGLNSQKLDDKALNKPGPKFNNSLAICRLVCKYWRLRLDQYLMCKARAHRNLKSFGLVPTAVKARFSTNLFLVRWWDHLWPSATSLRFWSCPWCASFCLLVRLTRFNYGCSRIETMDIYDERIKTEALSEKLSRYFCLRCLNDHSGLNDTDHLKAFLAPSFIHEF